MLREAHQRAVRLGRPVLASVALPVPATDPLAFFARGQQLAEERLLWTCPRTGYAMVGVDADWVIEPDASVRFRDANARWKVLQADAVLDLPPAAPSGVGPVLMGGFAFDPDRPTTALWDGFPAGRLVFPRYLLTCVDGATWLTVNHVAMPDAEVADAAETSETVTSLLAGSMVSSDLTAPAPTVEDGMSAVEWKAIIAALTREMRAGRVEKVVLARLCQLTAEQPFDLVVALDRLRNRYPSCFVFAIGRGRQCFMGATPERLVRLREGMVSTMCLAGSIARGATEDEDRRLGEALLTSEKDRAEHAVVVRTLRGTLGELCEDLAPVDTPVLLKVSNIQHLLTTMVGRVAGDRTILDLVERLHPTPASGGAPRETALRLIRERERLDRGWYAGPVGWLDGRGEGEFAVALRSALVRDAQAFLFAGCGIVADSDPQSEFEESRWKLRPMLAALGGDGA